MKKKVKPKVKKAKPKAKPKKAEKKAKKIKPKTMPTQPKPIFDDDSDWRLKEVHLNVNQAKKALYDLSINVEGEHDHICKTIQRCHDRIEHAEGLILGLSDKVAQLGARFDILNESTLNLHLIIESLVANIAKIRKSREPYDWKRGMPEGYSQPWGQPRWEKFGAKEKADAEERIREALKDMDGHPNKGAWDGTTKKGQSDDDEDLR